MISILFQWFKPKECFRKYYTMEKFHDKCRCLVTCQYPPPSKTVPVTEEAPLNIVMYDKVKFKYNFFK